LRFFLKLKSVFLETLDIENGDKNLTVAAQDHTRRLVDAFKRKDFKTAEKLALSGTQNFPNFKIGWQVLSALYGAADRKSEATQAAKAVVMCDPADPNAHFNLGVALYKNGELESARAAYNDSLRYNPDDADAYANLGVIAHDLGQQKLAFDHYDKALKLAPNVPAMTLNIVSLLTTFRPSKIEPNSLPNLNEKIRQIGARLAATDLGSDGEIFSHLAEAIHLVQASDFQLWTNLSQITHRNFHTLNCERHLAIFSEHNIIPEYCFGCYKVQIEPQTVTDLIKLNLLFQRLELEENNIRKCMVELRPAIPGKYKGLVYCPNPESAARVVQHMKAEIAELFERPMNIFMKRGCSEYSLVHPDYARLNTPLGAAMNYDERWRSVEKTFDLSRGENRQRKPLPRLNGLNLEDILIICKWAQYASCIGDESYKLVTVDPPAYSEIAKLAVTRVAE